MIIFILISSTAASVGKTIGHNEVHYCPLLLSHDATRQQLKNKLRRLFNPWNWQRQHFQPSSSLPHHASQYTGRSIVRASLFGYSGADHASLQSNSLLLMLVLPKSYVDLLLLSACQDNIINSELYAEKCWLPKLMANSTSYGERKQPVEQLH